MAGPLRITKGKTLLAAAAICSIAFGLTWVMGLLFTSKEIWPNQYRLLGAAFFVGLICTALWARQVVRYQVAAQRYFEALEKLDHSRLADHTLASDLPVLEAGNPWRERAARFTELLERQAERVAAAEREHAAMEVRMQRSAAREHQIESILANLPEAVLVVSPFGEVVLANPAAEDLLGFDLSTTRDRSAAHLLKHQSLVELAGEMRRRRGPTQRTIELCLGEGPEARWYAATVKTMLASEWRSDEASAGGVFLMLRDITSVKASNKRNAEFVSAASHEMKTPLAGIKAYVELLADGDVSDDKTRDEFLGVINAQADRLQRMIDNLLNLARIEAGVVRVSKDSQSLNELLLETIELVRPSAEAKQIELAADLSQMYIAVRSGRDVLMQAAINLLSNAIKYTPAGGRVALRSRLADQEAVLEVQDTGVGLSAEDRQRVFEKFYRVKKNRDMAGGTGLGLPLAKHIVEDVHGGRLTVDSELGCGSTFRVTLPVAAQLACHV